MNLYAVVNLDGPVTTANLVNADNSVYARTLYEEFDCKRLISIYVQLRYLRLKLPKNKIRKHMICLCQHNFKYISFYMREVPFKWFYFVVMVLFCCDDGHI